MLRALVPWALSVQQTLQSEDLLPTAVLVSMDLEEETALHGIPVYSPQALVLDMELVLRMQQR